MRHLHKGKTLGRKAKGRKALMRSLAVALIRYGRIRTTLARAKAVQPIAEKLISRARRDKLRAFRDLRKFLDEASAKRLIEEWMPALSARKGGYTRIIKLAKRRSDGSAIAYLEFTEKPQAVVGKIETKSKRDTKKKKQLDKAKA